MRATRASRGPEPRRRRAWRPRSSRSRSSPGAPREPPRTGRTRAARAPHPPRGLRAHARSGVAISENREVRSRAPLITRPPDGLRLTDSPRGRTSPVAMAQRTPKLACLAWSALVYNVLVILWGAFVRATGSGAGCGAHWPLCNGEVVPQSPTTATIIELTHRITSSGAGLVAIVLCIAAWRATPKGASVRRAAAWVLFFEITEGAVGASIVLLRYVGNDASAARSVWIAAISDEHVLPARDAGDHRAACVGHRAIERARCGKSRKRLVGPRDRPLDLGSAPAGAIIGAGRHALPFRRRSPPGSPPDARCPPRTSSSSGCASFIRSSRVTTALVLSGIAGTATASRRRRHSCGAQRSPSSSRSSRRSRAAS